MSAHFGIPVRTPAPISYGGRWYIALKLGMKPTAFTLGVLSGALPLFFVDEFPDHKLVSVTFGPSTSSTFISFN
ncbi:hypothetical protein P691DRAFT_774967 [Macrolepiota fuliginosa MF-IS2]|uniref:Uncharacterized protein n=1 Tax=Macrolepiota fuliginosa MF-IS2 TaxID=1400762 RepID=A0A9P6C1Z4_9AGAR|nr:hypothetical protein P691DRAFT_774967 [Macrolepiota fuliginosa MF-IS2]